MLSTHKLHIEASLDKEVMLVFRGTEDGAGGKGKGTMLDTKVLWVGWERVCAEQVVQKGTMAKGQEQKKV